MTTRYLIRALLVLLLTAVALAPVSTRAATVRVGTDFVPGTWTPTGSLHHARMGQTATLLPSGDVLVAGGNNTNNAGTILASAELYHPGTGTWTPTGSLHIARAFDTATLLPSGLVLVVGGCGVCATDVLASAELYDPRTGTWTVTGSMPTARDGQSATLLRNGQVLVVGGCISDNCATVAASAELYHPRTGTWTTIGSLHDARWGHTATLLPSGDVLVAGGNNTNNAGTILSSAELYHPGTSTWVKTGAMHTARAFDTATLLPSGLVLVVGGCGVCQADVLASAEIYNPHTGKWTVTGSMHTPRDDDTMAFLPNGQVLVVGGWNGTDFVASAELYTPRMGTWTTTGSLQAPHAGQTITRLLTGRILVVGGHTNDVLASAELYHP